MQEQLEERIFNTFTNFLSSPERRPVHYNQLGGLIFKWSKKYFPETKEMGVEITSALKRIFLDENDSNIPLEKEDFFKYLRKTLRNAENEYYRNNQTDLIKNPRILKDMVNVISMQEHNLGKELSEEEKVQSIIIWFNKSEKSARKYLKAINTKTISNITNQDGDEINAYDSGAKTPYMNDISNNPFAEQTIQFDKEEYKKAVKEALDETQDRARDCYRALYTLRCIRKIKDYSHLTELLDKNMLDACQKNGKKPTQKEIYLKYHPEVTEESAEVSAAVLMKEFLKKLDAKLENQ